MVSEAFIIVHMTRENNKKIKMEKSRKNEISRINLRYMYDENIDFSNKAGKDVV